MFEESAESTLHNDLATAKPTLTTVEVDVPQ